MGQNMRQEEKMRRSNLLFMFQGDTQQTSNFNSTHERAQVARSNTLGVLTYELFSGNVGR